MLRAESPSGCENKRRSRKLPPSLVIELGQGSSICVPFASEGNSFAQNDTGKKEAIVSPLSQKPGWPASQALSVLLRTADHAAGFSGTHDSARPPRPIGRAFRRIVPSGN